MCNGHLQGLDVTREEVATDKGRKEGPNVKGESQVIKVLNPNRTPQLSICMPCGVNLDSTDMAWGPGEDADDEADNARATAKVKEGVIEALAKVDAKDVSGNPVCKPGTDSPTMQWSEAGMIADMEEVRRGPCLKYATEHEPWPRRKVCSLSVHGAGYFMVQKILVEVEG